MAPSIEVDLAYVPNAVPLLGIESMSPDDDGLGGVAVPRNGDDFVAKAENKDEKAYRGGEDGGCGAEG